MKIIHLIILLLIMLDSSFDAKLYAQENLGRESIKVYLLGTFHFNQTDESYNVLEEHHQKSIENLCEIIAKQRPDKVFIERQPEYEHRNKLDSLYQFYLTLKRPLKAKNELYQVGFRLARMLGHDKVYQCDHPGQYKRYNAAATEYAENHNQMSILNGNAKTAVMRHDDLINEDSLMQNSSLLEYIQWINSPKVMNSSHASYVTNYPQIGSYGYYNYEDDNTLIGAELTSDWYHRNIMIYTKMINQVEYEKDKAIFLLMGADHIPIIKSLFDANPYFTVIETKHWLVE